MKECTIKKCGNTVHARGWCGKHYRRWVRYGDPTITKIRERGTGTITTDGYLGIYFPDHPNSSKDGLVYEHRLVMSNYLGRPLEDDEEVHHLNGDRLDNRIENLELWSISQPPGQRVKDKVKWAWEILERYSPESVVYL